MPATVLSRFVYRSRPRTSTFRFGRLGRLGSLGRYRSAAIFWIVTIALGFLTARVVSTAREPYPAQWGDVQRIATMTRTVSAGNIVQRGDVTISEVPAAFIPMRSAHRVEQIIGRRAARNLIAQSPIDLTFVSPGSASALSEAVGEHRRGFALPADTAPIAIGPADHVDIFVNRDGDGELVASVADAKVIRLSDRQVLVSVTDADAKRLASAMSNGRPTIVLVGG